MTINKLKYFVTVIIFLMILTGCFIYYKQIKEFIFNLRIPKNVIQTGAVLTTPTTEEIYKSNQLYKLLDMGVITTENFILTPIPKKREFKVKLVEPVDKNKEIFNKWLIENRYNDIDSKKFVFSN